MLWVQPLNSGTAQPLAGTEGATFPFWSADSRYLGYFADGKLNKIDASGGTPHPAGIGREAPAASTLPGSAVPTGAKNQAGRIRPTDHGAARHIV